jgi:DNA polymerase (family X)
MFSINPDAQTIEELDLTSWGVVAACKGGISPDRVLNCLSLDDLVSFLRSRRARTFARSY